MREQAGVEFPEPGNPWKRSLCKGLKEEMRNVSDQGESQQKKGWAIKKEIALSSNECVLGELGIYLK